MDQSDITVGDSSGLGYSDGFIIMALTAPEALYLVLAGFRPKAPALVS
jgi:hypothetical protein